MKRLYFYMRIIAIAVSSAFGWAACQSVVFVNDLNGVDDDKESDNGNDTSETDNDQCAPTGTTPLVCENFELNPPTPSQLRNGDVALEQTNVFDGNASMRCETTAIESFGYISNRFEPISQGIIYFRVHIFIPEGTITGTTKVLNLTSTASSDLETSRGIDVNISSNRRVEIYQHGNQLRFQSAPDAVLENIWFCLQGSYTISETAGETSIWIDNKLAVSTTATIDSIINGGVSEFRTGIGWTEQGQNTAVFYFDNILVDTAPVLCAVPSNE
ncbi:MAG: hypothetical protein JXR76_18640 [Deltaproteobacteria bacterium]|nr:hypothetical protein [Deltaproteobacteria bacterium]